MDWIRFECDGRTFEYAALSTEQKTHPPSTPAHKLSRGAWVPIVLVVVRKPGDETGPAMVYPYGTIVTKEHAVEAARFFWSDLTK